MVVVTPDFVGKPAPKPAPKAEEKKTKKSGK
jgi:hypothetical protein